MELSTTISDFHRQVDVHAERTIIRGRKIREVGGIVELLNTGKPNIEPIISLTAPLEREVELYARLVKDPRLLIKVILTD